VEVSRGEVWTVSGGPGYAGKPRPAVAIQSDLYAGLDSVTLCLLTSAIEETPITRPLLSPDARNGLKEPSRPMVDKITTVPRSKLGRLIGRLSNDDTARLDRALAVFFGLAR